MNHSICVLLKLSFMRCVRCISCVLFAPGMSNVPHFGCISQSGIVCCGNGNPGLTVRRSTRLHHGHSGRGLVHEDTGSWRRMLPVSGSTSGSPRPGAPLGVCPHATPGEPCETCVSGVRPGELPRGLWACARRHPAGPSTTGLARTHGAAGLGDEGHPASCSRRGGSSQSVYAREQRDRRLLCRAICGALVSVTPVALSSW